MNALKIRLFSVVTLLLTSNVLAAKYEVKSIDDIANRSVREAVKIWVDTARGSDYTGYKVVQILSRKDGEAWTNTVKQVLWGSYTDSIEAEKIDETGALELHEKVKELFEANYFLMDGEFGLDPEQVNLVSYEIASRLSRGLSRDGKLLFEGRIKSTFGGNDRHLTVVDVKNFQIVSIYGGGYSK